MAYTAVEAQRDLNAHAAARVAAAMWGQRYAESRLGLMGFWDTLTTGERRTAAQIAQQVRDARPYTGTWEAPNGTD